MNLTDLPFFPRLLKERCTLMSHSGMSKPNLPSIQFLLQEADETAAAITPNESATAVANDSVIHPQIPGTTKRRYGHRVSRSVSSLPVDLQALSLQGPEDGIEQQPVESVPQPFLQQQKQPQTLQQPSPFNGIPSNSTEKPPSWMLPNDRPPVIMMNYTSSSAPVPSISSSSASAATTSHSRRKPPYTGHGRSVSEFTLPPISSALSQPLPYSATPLSQPSSTTTPLTATTSTSTTTSKNIGNLSPHTAGKHAQSHHTHRRAISANTLDFMLTPSSHAYGRAQSYSPQEQSLNLINHYRQHPPPSNFFEQLNNVAERAASNTSGANKNPATVSSISPTDSSSAGRYVCPYCQKKFSRPSSLRIHTYSHTGEKPFVCTEPGCGRHFSVQSNMRRHLRVHRLGRNNNNSSNNNINGNRSNNATPTVFEEDIETS